MRNLIACAVLSAVVAPGPAEAETTAAPLAVEIITVESRTLTREYSLTGEVKAQDSVSAAFPVAGRVIEVLVEEGETVTAGQTLARMYSVQQRQALRAAEAGLNTALADDRQAAEDLARSEALLERGAATRAARDADADARQVAAGALAQARADLDRARKALNDAELSAPADATVTDRMVEAGQVVGAAQPVLELALSNGFEAVFDVPEALLTGETVPTSVRLARLDDPSATFSGTVSEVSPLVDASTGTVAVTVAVSDPPPGLSFGEAVRGTATFTESGQVVLPYTALSATGDSPAVWEIDPETDTVSLTPIEIERYATGEIVVAGGIEPGDRVVARGAQLLYPGRAVRPADDER